MSTRTIVILVVGALLFVLISAALNVVVGALVSIVLVAILLAMAASGGVSTGTRKQFEAKQLAAGYKYATMAGDSSGIAISPQHRLVLLRDTRGQEKQYPFDAIRGWKTNFQESVRVQGAGTGMAGLSAIGAANAMNRDARRLNQKASGLFIELKDIDFPVWRVGFQSQEVQNRWHEILTQYVKEGAA